MEHDTYNAFISEETEVMDEMDGWNHMALWSLNGIPGIEMNSYTTS